MFSRQVVMFLKNVLFEMTKTELFGMFKSK